MTTDVINGVPRCLLREILRQAEQNGNDTMATRALGDLLATAQPADHSEHALNMAAQPAADGEREAICCEHSWKVAKDEAWAARSFNECKCDHNEYCDHCFPPDFRKGGKWHAGYQPRAAQPQQTVAVTDEVRRLREALEKQTHDILMRCLNNPHTFRRQIVSDDELCDVIDARAALSPAGDRVVEELLAAFPLFDEVGLSETEHHCEWNILKERKRLHAILNAKTKANSQEGE